MDARGTWIPAAIFFACTTLAGCSGPPITTTPVVAKAAVAEPASLPEALPPLEMLDSLLKPVTGDLDSMRERHVVRILAAFNRTNYWFDEATQRGAVVDAGRVLEQALRQQPDPGAAGWRVIVVPVARGEAMTALTEGRGDLVLQVLTAVPEPPVGVVYSAPLLSDVREVVVTGPRVPKLVSLEDLAGRAIYVRAGSRHHESVSRLNARLKDVGKPGFAIVPMDAALEDEDLLELVNAGLIPATVTDGYVATAWRKVFTELSVNTDVSVSQDGALAWAVRSDSPKLLAMASERAAPSGGFFSRTLMPKDVAGLTFLNPDAAQRELPQVRAALPALKAAGRASQLPYSLLAARAFEDRRMGAPEITADARGLRSTVGQYFRGSRIDAGNQALFAVASTQADPSLVQDLRAEAARMRLDPNVWFGNVEVAATREMGRAAVEYVRRIHQYDVGFQNALDVAQGASGTAARSASPKAR